jgi:hypothetical protein
LANTGPGTGPGGGGGGGGGDPPGPLDPVNLTGVDSTGTEIRPREDARRRYQYEPIFSASLDNVVEEAATVTVDFYVGEWRAAAVDTTVPAGAEGSVSARVSWETLMTAVGEGGHTLRAEIRGTSMVARQSIRVHPLGTDEGGNGDDGGNFPTLPGIGGLTAMQTTGAAALLAAVILAVVL